MKAPYQTVRLAALCLLVAFAAGCGGDANEEGAATDTSQGAATAAGDVNTAIAVSPQEAVSFMAEANKSEVDAAKVAAQKATNAEVRRFAQKMQREHTQSEREVSDLARRLNVTLDSSSQQGAMVQSLRQMAQQMSQQLSSTPKGAEFDRVYIDGQVQAHQAVLENLQRIAGSTAGGNTGSTTGAGTGTAATAAAGSSQAPATPQEAAQKMIPHVQQHLDEARQIQSRLSSGGR